MQVIHYLLFCVVHAMIRYSSTSDSIKPDGFNFYKDYLRGKQDDIPAFSDVEGEKVIYFYRTPAALQPGSLADQEFRKRTSHMFKNHMLSRDSTPGGSGGGDGGSGLQKRVSKAALSWMLNNKHHLYSDSGKEIEDLGVEANLPIGNYNSFV